MKRDAWMSDAGYASGVSETDRHITAKRNPRNLKGRMLFGALSLALMAAILTVYCFTIRWTTPRIGRLFDGVPAIAQGAASAQARKLLEQAVCSEVA